MHKLNSFLKSIFTEITHKRTGNTLINKEWIEEIAELIEQTLLNKLILAFYTDKNIFFESFIFTFKYENSFKKENDSLNKQKKFINLMIDLPKESFLTLRLFHLKKELKNFKNEKESFLMNGNEIFIDNFNIKKNQSNCFINLKCISCFYLENEKFYLNLINLLKQPQKKTEQKSQNEYLSQNSQLTSVTTKLTNIFKKKDSEKANVSCICGIYICDGDMLFCDGCFTWSHTVCCGFFSNTDRRIPKNDYYCFFCIRKNKFLSQDKSNYHEQKKLALYRRVLSVIYNEGVNNSICLSKRLGISYRNSVSFINQLIYDGFLLKKEKKLVIQKNEEIKKRLKEYFTVIGGELIKLKNMIVF